MEKPILVFQSDFTYKEGAVCAMYGVVKSVDRSLEIFDGTHEIPRYDTWSASYRLYQSMGFWPKGTIFVSVVDPGVGTARRACVAKTRDGYYVVTPDNGSLTHVKEWVGLLEVREINEKVKRLQSTLGTSIFHGRDLFGYCAARFAAGIITYEEIGPAYPVEDIVLHKLQKPQISSKCVKGIFEISDPNFGNLWSNILADDFIQAGFNYGDRVILSIRHKGVLVYEDKLLFTKTFGDVNKGDALLYTNELMKLGVALSMDSFMERYKVDYGLDWQLEIKREG